LYSGIFLDYSPGGVAFILLLLLFKWLPEYNTVTRITIAANTKNSDEFLAIQALAKVVNSSSKITKISVLETGGTVENIALLQSGLVDMCTMQGDYPAANNIQLVSNLYTDVFQFIKQKELPLEDISQLAHMRIGISTDSDAEFNSFKKIMEHFNFNISDFKLVRGNWEFISWAFRNKEIDVMFKVRFPTSTSLRNFIKETNAELIPIKQASAICLQFPIYQKTDIPRGLYSGAPVLPDVDVTTVGIDRLLVANSSMNSQVVKEICETIFVHRRELSQEFDALGFSLPPNEYSFIPLHEGAKNYLNNKEPNFLQQNAEPVALILSVLVVLTSTVIQLLNNQKRRRVLNHNKKLIQLKFKIERSTSLEQLEIYKDELSGFVARVVDDAVGGKISSSGFEFFSFTWESILVIISEKEKKLENRIR
jgi:TRAP transporter TAXI family solute receptor